MIALKHRDMVWMKNSRETEISKRNKTEVLQVKKSICQIQDAVESLNNRLRDAEEGISEIEDECLEI